MMKSNNHTNNNKNQQQERRSSSTSHCSLTCEHLLGLVGRRPGRVQVLHVAVEEHAAHGQRGAQHVQGRHLGPVDEHARGDHHHAADRGPDRVRERAHRVQAHEVPLVEEEQADAGHAVQHEEALQLGGHVRIAARHLAVDVQQLGALQHQGNGRDHHGAEDGVQPRQRAGLQTRVGKALGHDGAQAGSDIDHHGQDEAQGAEVQFLQGGQAHAADDGDERGVDGRWEQLPEEHGVDQGHGGRLGRLDDRDKGKGPGSIRHAGEEKSKSAHGGHRGHRLDGFLSDHGLRLDASLPQCHNKSRTHPESHCSTSPWQWHGFGSTGHSRGGANCEKIPKPEKTDHFERGRCFCSTCNLSINFGS
mmetsp:Transcript_8479/g.11851  ORF Transcript_8479/g.11851 Transcript_8479/m.11851 type:complete len:361 (-) Transcript_8479:309-1391(-)